jgi:hypothetical protein
MEITGQFPETDQESVPDTPLNMAGSEECFRATILTPLCCSG